MCKQGELRAAGALYSRVAGIIITGTAPAARILRPLFTYSAPVVLPVARGEVSVRHMSLQRRHTIKDWSTAGGGGGRLMDGWSR